MVTRTHVIFGVGFDRCVSVLYEGIISQLMYLHQPDQGSCVAASSSQVPISGVLAPGPGQTWRGLPVSVCIDKVSTCDNEDTMSLYFKSVTTVNDSYEF